MNKSAVGNDAMKFALKMIGIGVLPYIPRRVDSVDIKGRTSSLVVRVSPKTRSFQIQVNWKRKAAPSAEIDSGRKMLR